MIEVLNGIQETVVYRNLNGIRLYHNRENENYPVHWHLAIEIIMPYQEKYSAQVGETVFTLNVEDILLIPPGELHSLTTPREGRTPDRSAGLLIYFPFNRYEFPVSSSTSLCVDPQV